MPTMAPPPPAGSTPEPLREIKRQRRERLAKPDENLANDTVESYLVKQRDLILAEMDGLTGRLVADHHDAVSKAKEALRQECPAAKPIAGPRAVTMVATTGPHKGIAFKMTVDACVEIRFIRRVRAESSRRPPRHRRAAPDALVDFHTGLDDARQDRAEERPDSIGRRGLHER